MSSFTYNRNSIPGSDFNEDAWVVQISRSIDEELEDKSEVHVSIFNVPKLLFLSNPDSYKPQQVAIGPYHYFTPEHYEMERYKVAAAKRIKESQTSKFHLVVDMIKKYESRIRAHYHRYLNFNSKTLAWMMAVDASFLLEFLKIYAVKEGKVLPRVPSSVPHFIDSEGAKSAHNAILRDVVMLENQIPLFLLREVLEFQVSSSELADDLLICVLMGFTKELSPFKTMEESPCIQVSKSAHLLDVLYHVIVPRYEGPSGVTQFQLEQLEVNEGEEHPFKKARYVKKLINVLWITVSKLLDRGPIRRIKTILISKPLNLSKLEQLEVNEGEEHPFKKPRYVKKLIDMLWIRVSKLLDRGPIRRIKTILISKPFEFISKLPWPILSNFPGVRLLKQHFQILFPAQDKAKKEENENPEGNNTRVKPPSVEEITIPSVTELSKAGVRFVPTNSGISSIWFDVETATFRLPTVCLDDNSEVVLRNLVAYEACNAPGPLVFARYTELMNGIIDTEEDAKLLREKGIILNHLKKDEEAAKLWNGMNRSIKLTKVEFLDKTIADVNKFYSRRWEVKVKNFVKHYVFESWKFLTCLAALLMLLLMALQSFCTVYSCPRLFHRIPNFQ